MQSCQTILSICSTICIHCQRLIYVLEFVFSLKLNERKLIKLLWTTQIVMEVIFLMTKKDNVKVVCWDIPRTVCGSEIKESMTFSGRMWMTDWQVSVPLFRSQNNFSKWELQQHKGTNQHTLISQQPWGQNRDHLSLPKNSWLNQSNQNCLLHTTFSSPFSQLHGHQNLNASC